MHFWIDKRSSQLHQYGGGRRGPGGAGGFYSQNFGTHRASHHPPASLSHHRIRNRSSSNAGSTSNNNNNNSTSSTNSNNNNHSGNSNASSSSSSALQYPHQQPHQVPQQQVIASAASNFSGAALSMGNNGNGGGNVPRLAGLGLGNEAFKNMSHPTTFFSHPPQQQPILGGGILAISGSSSSAAAAAAASGGGLNQPMTIVAGDEGVAGGSTTVLTLPPAGTMNVNPRGGIDLSWRNPYHVPGSSVSRCRAYSRDLPSTLGTASSSSRGTRGRRQSGSSSSGFGRNSIATGTTIGTSNHSQNVTNETPEGMTDRSTRSERTSIDRETMTPQRSLSLTSPDPTTGDQSSRSTSGRPSLENDPNWACTKRIGLTLCFVACILLGTVGAKFMIQGAGVIDSGKAEAVAYFLFTELIFVAFAMALFFTGVACLRKRTNDYLLRQFNQYIMNTSPHTGGTRGAAPGQDAYDFEYYDGAHPPSPILTGSPSRGPHHHHHGGFHNFRHNRSSGSLIEEGDYEAGGSDLTSPHNFHGAGPIHYPAHHSNSNSNASSSRRSKPPPYHIALFLPLPEGMGGESSPVDENDSSNNNDQEGGKPSKSGDGIGFIDSSSVKDVQDAGGNVNYNSTSHSNQNRDSSSRGGGGGGDDGRTANQGSRSETPPPPYEQL